eukprot:6191167-Pleurochrysis_carterae.AAC.2
MKAKPSIGVLSFRRASFSAVPQARPRATKARDQTGGDEDIVHARERQRAKCGGAQRSDIRFGSKERGSCVTTPERQAMPEGNDGVHHGRRCGGLTYP